MEAHNYNSGLNLNLKHSFEWSEEKKTISANEIKSEILFVNVTFKK